MPRNQRDWNQINISDLTTRQIRDLIPNIGRLANNRLYKLNASNIFSGAARRANYDLSEFGRKTFPVGTRSLSDLEVRNLGSSALRFLQSETSTLTGIRNVEERAAQTFREKGYTLANPTQFFQFLSSDTFKTLTQLYDSDEVLELIDLDLQEGADINRIIDAYQTFLLNELTLEEEEAIRTSPRQFR